MIVMPGCYNILNGAFEYRDYLDAPFCFFMKGANLLNKKFGRWMVIESVPSVKYKSFWLCKCECGTEKIVASTSLISGLSHSCGCFRRESTINRNITHNLSKSPEYNSWCSIKERCYNTNCEKYKYYGGRGIKMCSEWLNDFKAFYNYIGKRPGKNYSVDRYPDPNGDYEPGNVRWATQFQQLSNFSRNVYFEYNGERKILSEWCRIFNVNSNSVTYHLKNGNSFDNIAKHYLAGYKNRKKSPFIN